ncbi:MAG: thiol:disulfide interchange protein DsbA/DsbL [Burkholderiales bacterium]
MNRLRRLLIAAIALAPLAARGQPRFVELERALPVEAADRIEVIEFFWYGCIHCYNFEPLMESWLKKVPPDVQVRRVPAVFNERMARDAAIFYAFESLGVAARLHRPLFDAIHRGRLRTDQPHALAEWLQRNGIDAGKFDDMSKSFGVQSRVRRAAQLSSAYKIDGTPAMAVHGRYAVSSSPDMLRTVEHLIETVRKPKP